MSFQDIIKRVNWLAIIRIIAIPVLLIVVILLLLKIRDKNNTIDEFKNSVINKDKEYKQVKTKLDNYAGEVEQTRNNQVVTEAIKKAIIDSVSSILKVKAKTVQGITSIQTSTSGTYSVPIIATIDTGKKDSSKITEYKFEYHDGYLTFNGRFKDLKGNIIGDYNYRDSINMVKRIENNKVFIDAYSNNRKSNIVGLTSFEVEPQIKKTGIVWKIVAIASSGLLIYKSVR